MAHIPGAWRADVRRAYGLLEGGTLRRSVYCARTPGVQAAVVFRFGQWTQVQPVVLRIVLEPVYFFLNGLVKILWGIELPRGARVGPGLYIGHFGGVTVSSAAVIGSNCNLSQNITIGVSGFGDNYGVPVIGDNVYIAPGARLFGKIVIGHNVKIGANAVIHRDIPDNAIAALDPGFRIISLKGNRRTPVPRERPSRSAEERRDSLLPDRKGRAHSRSAGHRHQPDPGGE
jgi:serine O-acetyltransferase